LRHRRRGTLAERRHPTPYSTFFSYTWRVGEWRKKPEEQYNTRTQGPHSKGLRGPRHRLSLPPARHPGIGTSGGVTFILEDRPARTSRSSRRTSKQVHGGARKRPELAAVSTTFPPLGAPDLHGRGPDKVLKQGVNLSDVYKTLQVFLGSGFVNYFNPVRPPVAGLRPAEGDYRTKAEAVGQFYVRNSEGRRSRSRRSRRPATSRGRSSPCGTTCTGPAQINASAARDSARPSDEGAGGGLRQTMPREMGFDYLGMSFQGSRRRKGSPCGHLRLLAAVRLPDPGGPV